MRECSSKNVMAMYDVRGIQKYIFRTTEVTDAIGASSIIENIIQDALRDAVKRIGPGIASEISWFDKDGVLPYEHLKYDVQVLFIGGGNAYVMYRDMELCRKINKLMSKYVLEHTYSLRLAIAVTEVGDNYSADYQKLHNKMIKVKERMSNARPLGALPIMQTEPKTGYPGVGKDSNGKLVSTETSLKKGTSQYKQNKEDQIDKEERRFDNLVTEKGKDSRLAVVHIDGNSMGMRIRQLIEKIKDYEEAVTVMRNISYQINHSFKKTFEEMKSYFESKVTRDGKKSYVIRKILVAGDDITYVCNAKIAFATVEYYCRKIATLTMNGKDGEEDIRKYGFSVCAGIAFIGSHFPFWIGYNVAEELCESAKDRAKAPDNIEKVTMDEENNSTMDRVGNFVDFHICKNIQAQNLGEMRGAEYVTRSGENLLIRPYYISVPGEGSKLGENAEKYFSFNTFKRNIRYFNEEKLPRSFAKEIRNTYALGRENVQQLSTFLQSRGHKMPDDTQEMYFEGTETAKWYDALELMDYYIDLEEIDKGKELKKNETISD